MHLKHQCEEDVCDHIGGALVKLIEAFENAGMGSPKSIILRSAHDIDILSNHIDNHLINMGASPCKGKNYTPIISICDIEITAATKPDNVRPRGQAVGEKVMTPTPEQIEAARDWLLKNTTPEDRMPYEPFRPIRDWLAAYAAHVTAEKDAEIARLNPGLVEIIEHIEAQTDEDYRYFRRINEIAGAILNWTGEGWDDPHSGADSE